MTINATIFKEVEEKSKLTDLAGCCTGMFDDSLPIKDVLKQARNYHYQEEIFSDNSQRQVTPVCISKSLTQTDNADRP